MDTDSKDMRELINSSLGERLEQLRGMERKEEKKKRGKKIRVYPGESYCADQQEEKVEDQMKEDQSMEDNDEENEKVEDKENWGHAEVDGDGKVTAVDGKEEGDEDLPDIPVTEPVAFPVGSYESAVVDSYQYLAQLEEEEPKNQCDGFVILKQMLIIIHNQSIAGDG